MSRIETIGNATLYLGDCRELLPFVKADVLVTDPPYGVNLGNHGAALDARANHVLVKSGYENYDDTEENLVSIVVPAINHALRLVDRGLVFCAGSHIWHFPRADLIGGIYLPAAQGRNKWGFTSFWPCLLYGAAPDLHLGSRATAYRSTAAADKCDHPCPKPTEWMMWAVDLTSRANEIILDPFMGSGTTGIAAMRQGRKFVGMEVEPKYFDLACKRIDDAMRQGDLFIESKEDAIAATIPELLL